MKLLFYINIIANGGAERVISNLATQFSEMGHDVILVASYPHNQEYSYGKNVNKVYLSLKREDRLFQRNIKYIRKLRSIIKKEKPDTVVAFMADPNLRLLLASLFLKTKKIVSVRNDPNKEYGSKMYRILAKLLFNFADTVVIQTEEVRKWFPKSIQKKCTVIMNQVKEDFFVTPHVSDDYFVATGRLVKQKNYPLMISAFAEIVKEFKEEKLLIYGEGDQKDNLLKLIKEQHLENNVFLMGRTSNMPEVLSHAKCFLLSSDFEGMPNGLLEAMAMGIPCISTDCPVGGPRSIIVNDRNGLLFLVNDKDGLVLCIKRMLCNPGLMEEIGKKSKETAQAFLPKTIIQKWNQVLTIKTK